MCTQSLVKLQNVDIIDSYLMVHPFIFTGGKKLFNLPFVFFTNK